MAEYEKSRCPGSGRGHAPSGLERLDGRIGQFECPVAGAGVHRRLSATSESIKHFIYMPVESPVELAVPIVEVPAERTAAKELMRRRLDLAATLGAVGLLTVPQFGSAPRLLDLSPYKTGAELERELFVEQVGDGVAIMADFFHMNIEEADIRAAGQHIVHVHVADSNRLQPGKGHVDFRPGFAALKEAGYDGYLGIECRISGPYDEALAESAALLREL
jgi:Xylose isomerase-like TIM barrel